MYALIALIAISAVLLFAVIIHDAKKHGTDLTFD